MSGSGCWMTESLQLEGPWSTLTSDRVNTEGRTGCSGLYWLHWRWRFLGLSTQLVSMSSYPHRKSFPYTQLEPLLAWSVPVACHPCPTVQGLASRLWCPWTGGAADQSHWSQPCPRLDKPSSLSLLLQAKCSSPSHQCPCAELTPVYQHLCCPGDLKLEARIQMLSNKCQVKWDNHFICWLRCCWYSPVCY